MDSPPDRAARQRATHKTRWFRRVVMAVVVLATVATFRRPLLRLAAEPLIVDQIVVGQTSGGSGQQTVVVLFGGDRRYDVAARLIRSRQASRVLLLEGRRRRIVQYGILPSDVEIARDQLQRRGVEGEKIEVLAEEHANLWEAADELARYLRSHAGARLMVLADRFRSRYARIVLDRVLPEPQRQRVIIHALPDRRYTETDWWRSRRGIKEFVYAWMSLAYAAIAGRPTDVYHDNWDPDAYERALRARDPR